MLIFHETLFSITPLVSDLSNSKNHKGITSGILTIKKKGNPHMEIVIVIPFKVKQNKIHQNKLVVFLKYYFL